MTGTPSRPGMVEELLRRERYTVMGALLVITLLAWAYLIVLTGQMGMTFTGGMQDVGMVMALKPWTAGDALFMFAMWAIMMVGMMIPSAAPMILLYALVLRQRFPDVSVVRRTSFFLAGYLLVWAGFSMVATSAQWGLEQLALLSPMMTTTNAMFAGAVLIIAGAYQWTPYKDVCLKHCREPVWFLSELWRDGDGGALRMGIGHGGYCLGCCWALMGLLFVGGVMNLLCVAAVAAFVLFEKVMPFGKSMGKLSAMGLVVLGVGIFITV